MSENTTPTPETSTDFDAWLAGVERPSRRVTLYAKHHLGARIHELDEQIAALGKTTGERSIGEASAAAELRAERDKVEAELIGSRMVFRVEATIEDEQEDTAKAVKIECRNQIKAAADAAAEQQGADIDIVEGIDTKERAQLIRSTRAQAIDAFVAEETGARLLANRVHVQTKGGGWEPVGRERLDMMRKRLGIPQMNILAQQHEAASTDVPEDIKPPFSPAP